MDEKKTTVQDPQTEEEKDILDTLSEEQITGLLRQVREMMDILESQWNATKEEFQLTDNHMKLLYQFNEEHRVDKKDEDDESYDRFNGLDHISEEEVVRIFGEEHPIIGIQHSLTLDRIKSVINDFFGWMTSLKEYRQIHDAHMELIEYKEEKEIEALQILTDKEQDPEKKAKMQESLDFYYRNKYLDFLADPIDNKKFIHIVDAFSNQKKVQYWINRCRDKLDQLKISSKFILEISQFEKRFLPEEYHCQNNIFLLYFMTSIIYTDMSSKKNPERTKVVCMIFAMDRFIRNVLKDDIKERIFTNMIAFQDQFIGKLPTVKGDNDDQE